LGIPKPEVDELEFFLPNIIMGLLGNDYVPSDPNAPTGLRGHAKKWVASHFFVSRKPEWRSARLLQSGADGCESGGQIRSHSAQDANDGNGNQRPDQAIFDCGCSVFGRHESSKFVHRITP
jgi:hypothetical protein